ncbi:MAG TPA: DVUA0089 family protein [Candidatus Omnitrophota bacterium]|nr:DVUA0089 family protein [Candidatus Omnitrophota bacterium]HPS20991.1 DVUA0089 family protein [Candidatus Omnitrophota bacterium]
MKKIFAIMSAVVLLGFASLANADDYFFSGTFTSDDEIKYLSFHLDEASPVVLRTYSYAGGTDSDGNVISGGGFDPVLSLFNSSYVFIDDSDDGDETAAGMKNVGVDAISGKQWDSYLVVELTAGDYVVVLTQADNDFSGDPGDNISEGFENQGAGNYTPETIFDETGVVVTGSFWEEYEGVYNQRTGNWAVGVTSTPEPVSSILFGIGAGMIGIRRMRKNSRG